MLKKIKLPIHTTTPTIFTLGKMFKKVKPNDIIKFVKKYKQQVLAVLGIFAAIVALVVYFIIKYQETQKSLLEKLSIAENLFYSERYDESLKLLDELIQRFPKRKLTVRAALLKAYILYNNEDFLGAKKLFTSVLNYNIPYYSPFALLGLSLCEENIGNYEQTEKIYRDFIEKYPNHFLTPRAYELLAALYELNGSTELAKSTYDKLLVNFPGSYWSTKAEKKLKELRGEK